MPEETDKQDFQSSLSKDQVSLQAKWEKVRDKVDLPVGANAKKLTPSHRELFLTNHPTADVRCEYDLKLMPTFEGLVIEDGEKIDTILQHAKGGKALVVGASGFSFLNALINDVQHVDIVDLNPNQVIFNYFLAAFIILTNKENLISSLEAFEKTRYRFDDYFSIKLPKIRKSYLDRLPQVLDQLQVPPEMRGGVVQNFNYHALDFGLNMGMGTQSSNSPSIWKRFYAKYEEIQQIIRERKGFDFIVANLLDWATSHPNLYDVIYTSNVFQYRTDKTSLEDFLQALEKGLKSGGITNVYHRVGIPNPHSSLENSNRFKILIFESYYPDDEPNYLVVQKN